MSVSRQGDVIVVLLASEASPGIRSARIIVLIRNNKKDVEVLESTATGEENETIAKGTAACKTTQVTQSFYFGS